MLNDWVLLIARLLMATLFLGGGIPKLLGNPGERDAIAGLGFPMPGVLERLAGLLLVAGAAAFIVGAWMRPAAMALAAFVVVVTPLFLHFWTVPEPEPRAKLAQAFAANLGVLSGLLVFAVIGPGSLALLPGT